MRSYWDNLGEQKMKRNESMIDSDSFGLYYAQSNSSWLGSLIGTVIGNLKLSITNIHIRYEDTERYS